MNLQRLAHPRYRHLVTVLIWIVTLTLVVVRFLVRATEPRNQDIIESYRYALDDTQPIPIIKEVTA